MIMRNEAEIQAKSSEIMRNDNESCEFMRIHADSSEFMRIHAKSCEIMQNQAIFFAKIALYQIMGETSTKIFFRNMRQIEKRLKKSQNFAKSFFLQSILQAKTLFTSLFQYNLHYYQTVRTITLSIQLISKFPIFTSIRQFWCFSYLTCGD